ncbi:MAG: GNAT family N-acetyltransferase [Actinomycetota bacterium]|nr:GNAT family N-acetyltransferase [Actinomycetota bacterium]
MPRTRLGVVLLVPPRAAAGVDLLRVALGAAGSVHHVPAHVTLVPPVNVAQGRLPEVEALVRAAAAGCPPVAARLGPPATFLPDNPVLYLRVAEREEEGRIAALRDAVFVEPLARPLTWPFVPHVTLMDGGDPARIGAAVIALADHEVGVVFGGLALLQEQRDEEGERVWRPLLEAPLGGPAVVGRGSLPLALSVGAALDADVRAWFDAAWDDHDRYRSGQTWQPAEHLVVVARRNGAVVGAATGIVRDEEGHLERLLVDEVVRGEGVGGHLLAAFTAAAVERGCGRLVLRTEAGGTAERFYVERGFRQVAVLPRWRRDADFVLLERPLAPWSGE